MAREFGEFFMQFAASQGQTNRRWSIQDMAGALFVLLLPFSIFWPLNGSIAPQIIPIYGSYGLYLTDLPVVLLLITSALNAWQHRQAPRLKIQPATKLVALALILIPALALVTAPWAINPQLALYTAIRWTLALGIFAAWQSKAFNIGPVDKSISDRAGGTGGHRNPSGDFETAAWATR